MKKNEARKAKSKNQDCCVTFKPKILLSAHAQLRKLIFCIWIKRPRSVQFVNGFMVSFSSLQHDSDQKRAQLASKQVFRQNFQGKNKKNQTL